MIKEEKNGILWEISGNGLTKPSYLFGTHHLLDGIFLKNVTNFQTCFDIVDQLVIERDYLMNTETKDFFLPENITYGTLLSESDFQKLDSVVRIYMDTSLINIYMTPGYLNYNISFSYHRKKIIE